MKSKFYKVLKYSNDYKAIKNGKVIPRIKRRILGKLFMRLMNKIRWGGWIQMTKKVIRKSDIMALTMKKGDVDFTTPEIIRNLDNGRFLTWDYKIIYLYKVYYDSILEHEIVYGTSTKKCDEAFAEHILKELDYLTNAYQQVRRGWLIENKCNFNINVSYVRGWLKMDQLKSGKINLQEWHKEHHDDTEVKNYLMSHPKSGCHDHLKGGK